MKEKLKKNEKYQRNSLNVMENLEDNKAISYELSSERENEYNK